MKIKKKLLEGNLIYTLVAIFFGFVIGAIFLMIAGISVGEAYGKLFDSIFGKPKYLAWTLVYASPLIFTGLSVAFSFRTGIFNIGAEGQFVIGVLVATVLGITLDLPAFIHIPVCILAAAAAGAIWSWLVGIMKVKRGIHEVLSFIMFNWIAFYLSNYVVNLEAIKRTSGGEASKDVADSARILFPEFIRDLTGCSSANAGIVIAVAVAIFVWVLIQKTTLGYKLKAVGYNTDAAKFAGINSDRSVLAALSISGALAGMGGAVHVLGMSGRLSQYAGQEGFGFQGITVALIAGSNPIWCILSGIFYGAMKYGGSKLTMVNAPSEVIDIIMGCVIIFISITHVYKNFILGKLGKGGEQ